MATSSGRTCQAACEVWESREGVRIVGSARGAGVLVRLVVLGEQVAPEVVAQVAPYRVDVVGVVLLVVVLDEDCRAMNAVVVCLANVGAAGPCEAQLAESSLLHVAHGVGPCGGGHTPCVVIHQPAQLGALLRSHVRGT